MRQLIINIIMHLVETLPHLILVMVFFGMAFVVGFSAVKRFKRLYFPHPFFKVSLSLILGFLILSGTIFLLGILHALYKPVICGLSLLFLLIGVGDNRFQIWKWVGKFKSLITTQKKVNLDFVSSGSILLIATFAVYALINSTLPDWGFDSNWYHLTEPMLYLRQHSLNVIPGGVLSYSTMPQAVEMLYLIILSVGNSVTTSIFSAFIYILFLMAVFTLSLQILKKKNLSLLATAIIAGIPVILDQAAVAYIDIFLTMVELTALSLLILILEKENQAGRKAALFLLGILAGFSLGIKLLAGIFVLILFLFVLSILAFESREENLKVRLSHLVLFLIPIILIYGPWALRCFLATGNPFSPQLGFLFSQASSSSRMVNAVDYTAFLQENPWWKIYRIPLWFVSKLEAGWPLFFTLFFLPFVSWKSKASRYLIFFILVFGVIWYYTPPQVHRYLMPTFPVIAALGVSGLDNLLKQKAKIMTIAGSFFLVSIIFQFCAYYGKTQDFYPFFTYALGAKRIEEFKQSKFVNEQYMFYDYDHSVKQIVGGEKIITLGVHLMYPALEEFQASDITYSGLDLDQITSFSDLKDQMQKKNYKYILTIRKDLPFMFAEYTNRNLDNDDLSSSFKLLKFDSLGSSYYLYTIK